MKWPFGGTDQAKGGIQDTVEELKEKAAEHGLPTDVNSTSPYAQSARTIVACTLTAAGTVFALRIYKRYLRRVPNTGYLKPEDFRKRSLYGYVTSVGDGDNFRLFHTPGGRLAGWGWMPFRGLDRDKKWLQDKTVHVRIAGIDAPELAHFGRPAQPFGQEALDWLRDQTLHRYVRAHLLRRDQYDRVVCSVHGRKWLLFKTDLGLEMLKAGFATVYEAKSGSEFGNMEVEYRAAEKKAKERKIGMWKEPGLVDKMLGRAKAQTFESPREYKNRMAKEELAK